MKRLTAFTAALVTACGAWAQSSMPAAPVMHDGTMLRPVYAAYTAEAGSAHLADTYLTPLRYTGWHAGLDYMRLQAMAFDPGRWSMQLHANLSADITRNPAGNASMAAAMLTLEWGMMRRWDVAPHLTLALGGNTSLQAGCLYNRRNGNNPASAKGAWTVGLTGMAAYSLRLGHLPVTLTCQPSLPVAGLWFAPAYGELYYEIYLGDRKGLLHPAWWGNYLRLDNLLAADLHLGRSTTLKVGYRTGLFSSSANHTVTHIYTHSLVLGLSGEWLPYSRYKR